MRKSAVLALAGVILAVTACASAPEAPSGWAEGAVCASNTTRVMADFDAARANACEIKGRKVRVTILPEATPINPSPWYAFRLETAQPQKMTVVLEYPEYKHRYPPKISPDGSFRSIDEGAVKISRDEKQARFKVMVDETPVYVTAQELFTDQDHRKWIHKIATAHPFAAVSLLGKSVEGREFYKIETRPFNGEAAGGVVFVGRQHPPEISGAVGFQAFIEEVFSATELAQQFRETYAVTAVPILNPDGVTAGNWRFSANDVDLNRDWGPFEQPETQAMRDLLAEVDERDGVALFLDFHATFKNVLYTQTDDVETRPRAFAERWHNALIANEPDIGILRQGGNNTNRTTSKSYVYKTYGAAAITYEMHEELDRETVREFSRMAAGEMMKIMLEGRERAIRLLGLHLHITSGRIFNWL